MSRLADILGGMDRGGTRPVGVGGIPELDRLVINPALGSAERAWVVDVMAHVRPAPQATDPVRRLV